MAEIAAGALVAEQIVSTGLEIGVAAAVAQPTQDLQATLTRLGTEVTHAEAAESTGNPAYVFLGRSSTSD